MHNFSPRSLVPGSWGLRIACVVALLAVILADFPVGPASAKPGQPERPLLGIGHEPDISVSPAR